MDRLFGGTVVVLAISLFSAPLLALEAIDLEAEDVDIRLEVDDWVTRYSPPPQNIAAPLVQGGKPEDYELMQECSRAMGLGKHVPRAEDIVVRCTRAAEAGFAVAHTVLADLYWAGKGVARDQRRATVYALKAHKLGDIQASRLLALYYSDRRSALYDPVMAHQWLQRSIEQADPAGYVLMARYHLYETNSVHRYEAAHRTLQACVDQFPSFAACQWALAENYFHGMGVAPDPERALETFIELYRKDRTLFANCYAWRLATSPWPDMRNAEEAIAVMKRLASVRELNVAEMDTFAAALAAAGLFDQAVVMQEHALEQAAKPLYEGGGTAAPRMLARMRERLEAFRKKNIWTERVTPAWLAENMAEHLSEADMSLASAGK